MNKQIRRKWHNMLVAALADRKLDPEEREYLERMRQDLGISQQDADQVVAEYKAGKGGIELSGSREERVGTLKDIIRVFLADGAIQEREQRFLDAIARHLKMDEAELSKVVAQCRRESGDPDTKKTLDIVPPKQPVKPEASAPAISRCEQSPPPALSSVSKEPPKATPPKPKKETILDQEVAEEKPPEPIPGKIHEKTGIELLNIPAGEFMYGDMSVGGLDEKKRIHAFCIGKYEVTNAQWMKFEKEANYAGREDYGPAFSQPDQPVVGVSLDDALKFCEWAGLRLPTEEEWERAARGTDGRPYAWGSDYPQVKLANYGSSMFDESRPRTLPVGSFPYGMSPAGCYDMVGNIDEWCYSGKPDNRGRFPIRGSNWLSAPYALNVYYHNFREREYRANTLGFRVAADA